jgi:hypothetical protein
MDRQMDESFLHVHSAKFGLGPEGNSPRFSARIKLQASRRRHGWWLQMIQIIISIMVIHGHSWSMIPLLELCLHFMIIHDPPSRLVVSLIFPLQNSIVLLFLFPPDALPAGQRWHQPTGEKTRHFEGELPGSSEISIGLSIFLLILIGWLYYIYNIYIYLYDHLNHIYDIIVTSDFFLK